MPNPNKIKLFWIFFVITNLSIVPFVFAQQSTELPPALKSFLKTVLGLPDNWLKFPDFTYNFLLPFLAMLVIFVAFMRSVKLFEEQSNMQILIGVIIVFLFLSPSALITGGPTFFEIIVVNTLLAAGVFTYFAFLAILFLGVYFYVFRRAEQFRSGAGIHGGYRKEIENLNQERVTLQGRLRRTHREMVRRAARGEDVDALKYTADDIRKRIEDIDERVENLQRLRKEA